MYKSAPGGWKGHDDLSCQETLIQASLGPLYVFHLYLLSFIFDCNINYYYYYYFHYLFIYSYVVFLLIFFSH